ncbi:MAG: uroporphyrinogen-III C-methyltransferase [Candidatus Omnitrophota bacterium]
MKKAKVYFIGAGPGDPGLITVRGKAILQTAEVIIYDYLLDKRLLDGLRPDVRLICADKLQKKINNLLIKTAKIGKKVVRLKNGDPSIFARLGEELEALTKNRIDFEIVPGVTAASAASAFAGIPLTERNLSSTCVFVTGQEMPDKKKSLIDWDSLSNIGTIVFYMAVGNLKTIVRNLIKVGKNKDTPVAVISDISLPKQQVLLDNLENIPTRAKKNKIKPPAIIIIGETVKLAKKFNWLNKSRRALFVGLSAERFFLKDRYEHVPLIKIKPLDDYSNFDKNLKEVANFDWIIFTSRFGVENFFRRLEVIGLDSRKLVNIKIAVIGKSTQRRLLDFAIKADLVPKNESSAGLAEEFRKIDIKGKKIFMPRSDISDKGLTEQLTRMGACVISAIAYRNIIPDYIPGVNFNEFNRIMFTSPSTVRNFIKRYKNVPPQTRITCIGAVTSREAKRCGLLG